MDKKKIKSILGIIFILGLFVFLSYLVQVNMELFQQYFDIGIWGMGLFVLILASSIVLAPISSLPLFPLGSNIWGWVITGTLGTIGWLIGAIIAFVLARKYGIKLVRIILPIDKIHKFEKRIPHKKLFWTVVFFRLVIPVDGVSYLMGLFSRMSLGYYTLATLIGLIPFTFMTAYLGSIPFYYQAIILGMGTAIFIIALSTEYYAKKYSKKVKKSKK